MPALKTIPARTALILTLLAGLAPLGMAQSGGTSAIQTPPSRLPPASGPFSPPAPLPPGPAPLPPGPAPLPPGPGRLPPGGAGTAPSGRSGYVRMAPSNLAATLATAQMVQSIRLTAVTGRAGLAAEIGNRVAVADAYLIQLRQRAGAAGGQLQTVFEERYSGTYARETVLRNTLQSALDLADLAAWTNAQAALAASYQDYADAAQQAEWVLLAGDPAPAGN